MRIWWECDPAENKCKHLRYAAQTQATHSGAFAWRGLLQGTHQPALVGPPHTMPGEAKPHHLSTATDRSAAACTGSRLCTHVAALHRVSRGHPLRKDGSLDRTWRRAERTVTPREEETDSTVAVNKSATGRQAEWAGATPLAGVLRRVAAASRRSLRGPSRRRRARNGVLERDFISRRTRAPVPAGAGRPWRSRAGPPSLLEHRATGQSGDADGWCVPGTTAEEQSVAEYGSAWRQKTVKIAAKVLEAECLTHEWKREWIDTPSNHAPVFVVPV